MLCTKEAADRARKAAFVLLVEMGRALLRWADIDDPKGMSLPAVMLSPIVNVQSRLGVCVVFCVFLFANFSVEIPCFRPACSSMYFHLQLYLYQTLRN